MLELNQVRNLNIPAQVQNWMIEQLHQKTDNLQIYNIDAILSLSLYESDGKNGWIEKPLGDLPSKKSLWLKVVPLSNIMPWQVRPAGESVLVARGKSIKQGKNSMAPFMISNMSHQFLHMGLFEPWNGFSYNGGCKQIWSGLLQKGAACTHGFWAAWNKNSNIWDYHFEYWMHDERLFF
jgi:hypothetical protein